MRSVSTEGKDWKECPKKIYPPNGNVNYPDLILVYFIVTDKLRKKKFFSEHKKRNLFWYNSLSFLF